MILYGRYTSAATRRVAITMRLLGLPYEHRPMSAFEEMEQVRAVNPVIRVPALELEGGEVLIESASILDYLDELVGPERALIPPSGPKRRRALYLINLAMGAVEKGVVIFYERNRRPAEFLYQPWIDRCAKQIGSSLAALDQALEQEWFMGHYMTQADVTTAVAYQFLKRVDPALADDERHAGLASLSRRCDTFQAFADTKPG